MIRQARARSTTFGTAAAALLSLAGAACAGDPARPTAPTTPLSLAVSAADAHPVPWHRTKGPEAVRAFVVDKDGALLAGSETQGLFRSDDEGKSWTALATLPEGVYLQGLARSDAGVLYAATDVGTFRSEDGGQSWMAAGLDGFGVRAIAAGRGSRVYAAASGFSGGVFRSDDGGIRWTRILPGLNPRDFIPTFLTLHKDDVFLGTHSDDVWQGVVGGETWRWFSGGFFSNPDFIPPVERLAVAGDDALLASWTGGVLRSVDGGVSWKPVLKADGAFQFAFDAAGDVYVITHAGVAYRSADHGITWQEATKPLGEEVLSFAITPSGRALAGSWQTVYRSSEPK